MESLLLLPEPEEETRPFLRSVPRVDHMSRGEFVNHFASEYRSGQHVTFLGPTQRGKTTLAHQLLSQVASPDRKAVMLAGKPPGRDPVMNAASKRLRMRIVEEWPPLWSPRDRKRNGIILRPNHGMTDPQKDDENLRKHFRAALIDQYKAKKDTITVVDEGYHVSYDLKLKSQLDSILMRGAPVSSAWVLVQRGRFMSYQIYDAPEWILVANDPDVANARRYSEIGGVNPREVFLIVSNLETTRTKTGTTISEFLAIKRSGPEMVIVDVD